jgi:flagellar basal-body rod protein FlgB
VVFEQKLQEILDKRDSSPLALTDQRHLPKPFTPAALEHADGDIRPILDLAAGNDLNTVDIDRETSELAKNQVLYLANSDMLRRKFAYLRYSIQEGR